MDINWENLSHDELGKIIKNLYDRVEKITKVVARLNPYGSLGWLLSTSDAADAL